MLEAECWMLVLDAEYRMIGIGGWVLEVGHWRLGIGGFVLEAGY